MAHYHEDDLVQALLQPVTKQGLLLQHVNLDRQALLHRTDYSLEVDCLTLDVHWLLSLQVVSMMVYGDHR